MITTAANIIGKCYGKLVVVSRANTSGRSLWHCRCDCGNTKIVPRGSLTNGDTKSCGCLRAEKEAARRINPRPRRDITGKQYGRLTVIEFVERRGDKYFWRCRCECGTERVVNRDNLRSGNTRSCGCMQKEQAAVIHRKRRCIVADLSGQRFTRLKVLSFAYVLNGQSLWNCLCDCGAMKIVRAQNLRQGNTLSCGCLNREKLIRRLTTHGRSHTPAYRKNYKLARQRLVDDLDRNWTNDIDRQLKEFQPECVVCGVPENLSTDHVRPISKGHGLRPGNAVRLCRSCNSQKHNKDLDKLPAATAEKIAAAAMAFANHVENI